MVTTASGRVQGRVRGDVRSFRGVPFAAPPVGERRFRPPAPHPGWSGAREATAYGSQAIQQFPRPPGARHLHGAERSEDCLYLNVVTPAGEGDGRGRPVMVWIHPGGFIDGAGSQRSWDGAALARHGDVVVVTFNYRLGAFGWLHLDHLDPELRGSGNLGLQDQMAALRWVRDNIAGFGGDPGNVTLFGQSSGAMSIAALLASPAASGLFHAAILQSGAAHFMKTVDVAAELTGRVMARAGVSSVEDLRTVVPERLVEAQAAGALELTIDWRLTERLDHWVSFGPVVDGVVLPEQPLDAIAAGSASDIPIIAGSTLDEWSHFERVIPATDDDVPAWLERLVGDRAGHLFDVYRSSCSGDPAVLVRAIQSDRLFRIPALRLVEAQSRHQPDRTHLYLFEWTPPRSKVGAAHGLEHSFVFGHTRPWELGIGGWFAGPFPPVRLTREMHFAWLAFARHRDPNHPLLAPWAPWTEDHATMHFDRSSEARSGPLDERLTVWTDII